MSTYPCTKIFHGEHKTIVISGPHIRVFDTKSGEILSSTVDLKSDERDSVVKSGPVRCAAVDVGYTHLATSGEDKKLKVWTVDGLKLLSERELPKKPTQIAFTRDVQMLVVSDKFGDVFSYPVTPSSLPEPKSEDKNDALASHENPSGGNLILGHTSLLTSFELSHDEKYIITADRDEHIRVSWYPQGYNIESYCMGHKKFVSAIHSPSFAPHILISGGGEPDLKVWDWHAGKRIHDIPVLDVVLSSIEVLPKKRKWGDNGDDDDGGEGEGGSKKPHGRKGRRKNKSRASVDEDAADGEEQDEGATIVDDASGTATPLARAESEEQAGSAEPSASPQPTLVVQKIDSAEVQGQPVVLFSAVGATSLFWLNFPSSSALGAPAVHAHDFGRPVLDFVRVFGTSDRFLVCVDADWRLESEPASPAESPSVLLRVVQLSSDAIVDLESPLVTSINANRIPATQADLATLDLYAHLTSMPKNTDARYNPMRRDGDAPAPDARTQRMLSSAKAAGKMKTRMKLLENAKMGEAERGSGEREVKRARSDVEGGDGEEVNEAMDQS
ncbi:WD40 repeat-like protein [Auriscalpium vulgare]|uniref:WD40 repeat-like protein n=1 Tax=Auriscalpium vulgare TaxID=40419 RepID=A0ACB8RRJ6_9AGAM|nr:WD40 repeat-like protein [Auriscalpium vulgare]